MQGGGTDPWETGSYDLALEEAQIEDFNVGGSACKLCCCNHRAGLGGASPANTLPAQRQHLDRLKMCTGRTDCICMTW